MAKRQNQILNNLGGPIFNPQPQQLAPQSVQKEEIKEEIKEEPIPIQEKIIESNKSDNSEPVEQKQEKPKREIKRKKKVEDDTPRTTSLAIPYSTYREMKLLTIDLDITMRDFILEAIEQNLKKYRK